MKSLFASLVLLIATLPLFAQTPPRERPEIAAITTESVLLRYRLTPGQTVPFKLKIDFQGLTDDDGKKDQMLVLFEISGQYQVKDSGAGDTVILEYTFTRLIARMNAQEEVSFNSDDPENCPPETRIMKFLLNSPFVVTLTLSGHIRSIDAAAMTEAIKNSGTNENPESAMLFIRQCVHTSFIALPAAAVKAGGEYKASAAIPKNAQPLIPFSVPKGGRVIAVSADKKTVLLEPSYDLSLPGQSPPETKVNAWILFDAEKGNIVESCLFMDMKMSTAQGGTSRTVTLLIVSEYSNAL